MRDIKPCLVLAVVVLALIGLVRPAGAQHHTADWSFIGHRFYSAATIGKVDRFGKMTTVLKSSSLPQDICPICGTLDVDDQTYVLPQISPFVHGSLLLVSQSGTLLQTIQVVTQAPQGASFTYDVILDPDGNYIVTEGWGTGTTGNNLLEVNRQHQVSTVWQGSPLVNPRSVTLDIDTGNFLLTEFPASAAPRVFSIAPDGSAITTIGAWPFSLSQIAQHIGSGDLFAPNVQGLLRMTSRGAVTTVPLPPLSEIGGVYPDRSSAANPRLVVASAGLYFVDLKTYAVTTLAPGAPHLVGMNHVFPNREVATLLQGPGKWDVKLHFAGEAGKAFALGLSLSGVRPGVALPDGRQLFLNPDVFTSLSVQGHLGAILQGNVGTLDTAGRATATLDVSAFPGVKGLRVWFLAVTLDPAAPLGIRTVADPVIVVL